MKCATRTGLYTLTALFAMLGTVAAPAHAVYQATASSQPQHRGPLSPDEELQHLTESLKLSSDQQTKVKPILVSRREQLTAIRADRSLSGEGKSAKMKALDEDANRKLMAVLNAEQKPKYEAMVQHRKEQMAQQRSRRSGARGD